MFGKKKIEQAAANLNPPLPPGKEVIDAPIGEEQPGIEENADVIYTPTAVANMTEAGFKAEILNIQLAILGELGHLRDAIESLKE